MDQFKGTTIVAVRRDGICAVAGDGQVTAGQSTVMKGTARKVRRIYHNQVVVGFAGSVADAFTLSSRFEEKLGQHAGNLMRSAVELAQDWRSDRVMRNLEAMLIVADKESLLVISGNGEVIDPDGGWWPLVRGGISPWQRLGRWWRIPICPQQKPRKRPSISRRTSAYSPTITSLSRK